jgi:hypothetical protein
MRLIRLHPPKPCPACHTRFGSQLAFISDIGCKSIALAPRDVGTGSASAVWLTLRQLQHSNEPGAYPADRKAFPSTKWSLASWRLRNHCSIPTIFLMPTHTRKAQAEGFRVAAGAPAGEVVAP